MFNSVVFNVVIGLVFIYLLYSLLATTIQELIAACFGMRSRMLKKGICRMLDDEGKVNELLSGSFYAHPLIKYLGQSKLFSKPSYMSAQNFSKVLIDLLRGKSVMPGQNLAPFIQKALDDAKIQWEDTKINPETLTFLKSLWTDAQGDVEKYKTLLEQWYDDTMERVSGWYKMEIQLILFCIGLFLAVFFNIDTISIATKLSHDPRLASQLANNASVYLQTHKELGNQLKINAAKQADTTIAKNITSSDLDSISEYMVVQSKKLIDSANVMIKTDIASTNELLGLGWKYAGSKENDKKCISISDNFHWWTIIGWLITALAISLGAPFWFDLLYKFISLRNAGKKPDEPMVLTSKNGEKSSVKRVG
jgi:hypothetical protein